MKHHYTSCFSVEGFRESDFKSYKANLINRELSKSPTFNIDNTDMRIEEKHATWVFKVAVVVIILTMIGVAYYAGSVGF